MSVLFFPVILLLIVLIFKLIFSQNKIKGNIGEFKTNFLLYTLNNNIYHIFKDITFKTTEGTTQIDHIVVCKYGIFVIETKNYNGWIFGINQPLLKGSGFFPTKQKQYSIAKGFLA